MGEPELFMDVNIDFLAVPSKFGKSAVVRFYVYISKKFGE